MAESHPRILVVDDDPDILDALADILEGEGYTVDRARHGQEALALLPKHRPDLILLDLMMPVMDGWEFHQKLQALERDLKIPVVVLSADREVSAKAKELGAHGYLAKPFELTDLLRLVSDSLTRQSPGQ